jgi:hypothetical protein
MNKEQFYNIFDEIFQELKLQFDMFAVEIVQYRAEVNESGEILSVDAIYKLIAERKYINLWLGFSTCTTKSFDIKVAINDNQSDYGFALTDYLGFRPVEFNNFLLFSHLEDYNDAIGISKQLFEELNKLIATEEMQKLLNTDYKIDVPRDWSPYK